MSSVPDSLRGCELRFYQIGDLSIGITSPPYHEAPNLATFRADACRENDLCLTVYPDHSLQAPAGFRLSGAGEGRVEDASGRQLRFARQEHSGMILYRRTERRPGEIEVDYERDYLQNLGTSLLLRWLDLPEAFLRRGGLLLHASLIRVRQKAILFTAPKQVGKSTQAELWRLHRGAEVLNGDRALIRRRAETWFAFSTPYSGTSGICRRGEAPLAAVVILRQGPVNTVRKATRQEAVRALISGSAYDVTNRRAAELVMEYALQVAQQIPFFLLSCLPDRGAVECLENAIITEGIYGE